MSSMVLHADDSLVAAFSSFRLYDLIGMNDLAAMFISNRSTSLFLKYNRIQISTVLDVTSNFNQKYPGQIRTDHPECKLKKVETRNHAKKRGESEKPNE